MVNERYKYTKRAQHALIKIYKDTIRRWGGGQADKYEAGIKNAVELLADNPELGRGCDEIRKGLHRHEHERHIIFYRKRKADISIVRIIYDGMDIKRHL